MRPTASGTAARRPAGFAVDCFGLTDIGRVRKENEDQFLVADLRKTLEIRHTSLTPPESGQMTGAPQGTLLLVADGMGGAACGGRASRVAVASVARYVLDTMPWCFRLDGRCPGDLREELASALRRSHEGIESAVERDPACEGMGTTFTMACLISTRAYVLHAGDSRCYLFRKGRLHQVTRDHTLAQEMVRRGVLKKEQAARSRWNRVLWNVVGGGKRGVRAEVRRIDLSAGDALLLCSDGLTKGVPDRDIAALLGLGLTAAETCRRLVEAANAAGGRDNVTVVAARLAGP